MSAIDSKNDVFLFSIEFRLGNRTTFRQYSYAFSRETVLERRSSQFHDIEVAESGPLRMLRFDTRDVQGVVHLQNPYIVLLDYMRLHLLCLLWHPEPERVLIIGLGAGILPQIIHFLSPKTNIDVVEIDAEVIDFARKYFDFTENKSIRLHFGDGRRFVERERSSQYDIIIVDVFNVRSRIPHTLRTVECFGEYLRILKSDGLISANFLHEQENRYRQTYARVLVKHTYRGMTKENNVLIGLNKAARIFNQTTLKLRASGLQHSKPLPEMNWVDELQHIHHENGDRWDASAPVFTDQISEGFPG